MVEHSPKILVSKDKVTMCHVPFVTPKWYMLTRFISVFQSEGDMQPLSFTDLPSLIQVYISKGDKNGLVCALRRPVAPERTEAQDQDSGMFVFVYIYLFYFIVCVMGTFCNHQCCLSSGWSD